MNERQQSKQASTYHHDPSPPPSPPSAAFIETFLHHQESAGGCSGMSSGEFELGLFRIDSGNDDERPQDNRCRGGDAQPFGEGSQHDVDDTVRSSSSNMNTNQDHWHGSLPLYTTSVDVDYAEATIVAPVDLEGGNILRVDMGMHRILVVQAPEGGVRCGEKFTAPYQIHHTPLSELEAFRAKAYNDGHYHGWIAKLFGCCEGHPFGAVCCPCVLLSTVMSRMHLNWCGKRISSISPSTQERRRRCTMFCIVVLYSAAFMLTVLLILHIVQVLYCTEIYNLFGKEVDQPIMREESAEEIEINSHDGEVQTCDKRINKAYLSSIIVLDTMLWGYILLLMIRARTAIREHHYIYGGTVEDCFVSCCCNCCTLSQLVRETDYEDHRTRRLSNVDICIGEPEDFLNESNTEGQHQYRPIVV
eukprot:CCRYP_008794-RB/>CCRYP_008794-RB protein AED:0.26 eAED:0.26 QI:254/1/1/1/0.5/0.66/3/152/416